MFENISYTSVKGIEYIINGDSPDLISDFSHKVLFSIEKKGLNTTFSYNIGISHQLWSLSWKIEPSSFEQIQMVKNIYLEKAKRLLDDEIESYVDITLTPVNMPASLPEAFDILQKK